MCWCLARFVTANDITARRWKCAIRVNPSIADVLDMTINRAVEFFENVPQIWIKIKVLQRGGWIYQAGTASTTLSAERASVWNWLRNCPSVIPAKTMYILDEPTTGLHFSKISVCWWMYWTNWWRKEIPFCVIEHNLDVIKLADYIIDMGPEGGRGGGQVLAGELLRKSKKRIYPEVYKEELEN